MKYFLIVRQQNNQMGDMLCSIPMYKAIKKTYPESHITLITAPTNYEIPFKKINPYIDNILLYEKKSLKEYLDFLKEVRNIKYDYGIVPSTLNISRTSNVINFLSKAKTRVGVKRIDDEFNKLYYLLNIRGEFDWNKNKIHQVNRILDVIKMAGCDINGEEVKNVEIKLEPEDIKFAEDFIKSSFKDENKPFFGFHPGAGKVRNIWSTKSFLDLIERLHIKFKCNVLITSGHIDKKITGSLVNELKGKNINTAIAENFEYSKLGALLKRLDLYVTNDTGVMHLAGFSGINTVSLFGPTNGFEWAPLKDNQHYIQAKTENIDDIKVEDVYNLINEKYEFR
jgi:heptosyltransferase II